MNRREAREQALCLVFERLFNNEPLPEIIELAIESRELTPDPFAKELAAGVIEHLDEIDGTIEKYSIGWSKSRLSKVVLSILRLAIFEISYKSEIPISVSINEAVELSKKYAGNGDGAFINGMLGAFVRSEKGEDPEKAKNIEKSEKTEKSETSEEAE
ncbi:MAG TPA: transcription antitermination factor NusB [Clostridia bacterium]|nr:transcription antitermination factor NusB [Clostridia bacterium]